MIDTAVIPCGGLGSRLYPATRWIPKELLPVALRPVLFWVLDEIAAAGLLRAVIVTNPARPLLEVAARAWAGPLQLEFVPQDHPQGLGDAIRRTRDALAGAPFLTVLPEFLVRDTSPCSALRKAFGASGEPTLLLAPSPPAGGRARPTREASVSPLETGEYRVSALGAGGGARLFVLGRVALPGEIFDLFDQEAGRLESGAAFDETPVLRRLAAEGVLRGIRCEAPVYDVGVPEGYRDAVTAWPARV